MHRPADMIAKQGVDQLALLGGTPAFAEPIHVGRPNIGNRADLMRRISDALDRRWLTNDGPFVRELEASLAKFLEVEHCIAMCNATVAMEVLARSLALSGQIVVPSFTFIATAHAFSWLGLDPVFCDVDPATHTLDPADVARALTPTTTAIMGVHLWGTACDVAGLGEVAAGANAHLLFDAAHAFACSARGAMVGSFGAAEVFSFHATKFFNTLEGGAVTTNDAALAKELRLMRNFGFSGYDSVVAEGTNAKMNELSAAMGLTSFDALPALLELNAARSAQYQDALAGIPGVRLVTPPAADRSNHQYFVLEVARDSGLTRDQLLALLWAENVRARRYFYPGCHNTTPYADIPRRPLPVTDRLIEEVLVLPTGGSVSEADAGVIAGLVRFALENADQLRDRIHARIPAGGLPA